MFFSVIGTTYWSMGKHSTMYQDIHLIILDWPINALKSLVKHIHSITLDLPRDGSKRGKDTLEDNGNGTIGIIPPVTQYHSISILETSKHYVKHSLHKPPDILGSLWGAI